MYTCIYTYIYIYIDMYWYTYKYEYVYNVRSCSFKLAMVRSANSRSGGSELCVCLYIHVCARVCVWTESEWKSKRMGKNKREKTREEKQERKKQGENKRGKNKRGKNKRGKNKRGKTREEKTREGKTREEKQERKKQEREKQERDLLPTEKVGATSSVCVFINMCVRVYAWERESEEASERKCAWEICCQLHKRWQRAVVCTCIYPCMHFNKSERVAECV